MELVAQDLVGRDLCISIPQDLVVLRFLYMSGNV